MILGFSCLYLGSLHPRILFWPSVTIYSAEDMASKNRIEVPFETLVWEVKVLTSIQHYLVIHAQNIPGIEYGKDKIEATLSSSSNVQTKWSVCMEIASQSWNLL